jgi:hypothetical protein
MPRKGGRKRKRGAEKKKAETMVAQSSSTSSPPSSTGVELNLPTLELQPAPIQEGPRREATLEEDQVNFDKLLAFLQR